MALWGPGENSKKVRTLSNNIRRIFKFHVAYSSWYSSSIYIPFYSSQCKRKIQLPCSWIGPCDDFWPIDFEQKWHLLGVCVKSLQLCPILCDPVWLLCDIVPCQAPMSMGFSRQEYWSGLPSLLLGIFLTQESNPCLLHLLHRQAVFLPLAPPGKPLCKSLSRVWLFATTWTIQSMGFSRPEYWSE